MARVTVDFQYELGQRAVIAGADIIGRVDSLSVDNNGPMYRVVYWNDGQRYQQWLYGWEIEPPQSGPIGYVTDKAE